MTQDKALEVLKSGASVFLTGEPGAGKTFTIGRFVEYLHEKNIRYAITASTGIAASHLNGSTIHSWAGLGIRRNLEKQDIDWIVNKRILSDKIKATRVLVIDEVSMIDAVTLDDVDRVLKAVQGNALPFGGTQVVLVGDFFQLPPVSRDGMARFAFEAESWAQANLQICYLTEQHRQSDASFLEVLAAIRSGKVTDEQKARLKAGAAEGVIETKLYTHNVDVEALNNRELAKLKGKEQVYLMSESGIPALCDTLKRSCLSPERLALKVGAVVMFTRNNFKVGYVNGSIGKVVRFQGGEPVVQLLSGETVRPEEAEWTFSDGRIDKASITQIPLRLAWAITVHKSQGMSLDSAEIDLTHAFEFGQGYVAISRVRSLAGLRLTGMNDKAFLVHPKVVAIDAQLREESGRL